MQRRFVGVLVLGVLLAVSGVCRAEDDFSGGILHRDATIAAAALVTTNVFPDANDVLVDGIRRVRYAPDGTYVQWHESYVKILTEAGRRSRLTLSSYFTIPYQRGPEDCRICLVEIIRPNGTTIPIDVEGESKVMINPASMKSNIYNPNSKLIRLNVAGLQVGDVLHYVIYDRVVQARMANTWSDMFSLEGTSPIVSFTAEVSAPASMPLKGIALKDEVPGTVTYTQEKAGDRILYRWAAKDVPRMFPEPNMPSMQMVVQRVLVSTNPDWETVSRWYWELSKPHFEMTSEMDAKVAELCEGAVDEDAKIQALFSWVAQEIRYMGITAETEAPGYEPHDVKDTFEARHGVCRDKAALLVVMLRKAGFDAFPTLIHASAKKDVEVAQPYFNHAIVAVRRGDDYILMDPTDETTKELLPSYLDDKSYLVATPKGETLLTSPIEPASANMMTIKTAGTVDAAGRLKATSVFEFGGINDNAYRRYFAKSKDEERRRLFETVVRRAVPGAHVTRIELLPTDFLDMATPLRAEVAYEADDILVRGGGIAMMPVPSMGARLGMVNFIIGKTGLEKREFPLETSYACGVQEQIALTLADALAAPVLLPQEAPVQSDAVTWELAIKQDGNRLTADGSFQMHVTEFSPEEYLALKETLKAMERALRKMPAYALPDAAEVSAGDIVTEVDDTTYTVLSRTDWDVHRHVRKRILTYAGKKKHSELKIGFNPAWEEIELVSAEVTSPDGTVSTISEKEINVMDAGWVGGAQRYPGAKTFVASLPGVVVGSVVDYVLLIRNRGKPFFSSTSTFGGFDAWVSKRVTLEVPADLGLTIHRHDLEGIMETAVTPTNENGRVTMSWEAPGIVALKREDRLPPGWLLHPTLSVSAGDWETYANRLGRVLKRATRARHDAAALARELTRDEADPWKQIEVIRNAVATRVRASGPALPNLPLSAISAADVTLQDGYGNATDRAVLLFAMLESVGLDVEFVLAGNRPAIAAFAENLSEVAGRGTFGHLLVRVNDRALALHDGRYVYLGDTDQYAAVGVCGHAGLMGLTIPAGKIEEILPERDNQSWREYNLKIAEDGTTHLTMRKLLYGTSFGAEKKRYSEMTPEKLRRHHQEMVGGVARAAEADGDLKTDFDGYPGRISFAVKVPDYAVRDGEYLYFTLPYSFGNVFGLRSDSRSGPLYLPTRSVSQTRITVTPPAGFEVVMLPDEIHGAHVGGARMDMRCTAETDAAGHVDRLVVRYEVLREPAIVEAYTYPELLDWDRDLAHRRARTVVLRKRTD